MKEQERRGVELEKRGAKRVRWYACDDWLYVEESGNRIFLYQADGTERPVKRVIILPSEVSPLIQALQELQRERQGEKP